MHIRCWGARGSIAVSGKEYLRYGGDTTCMEIRTRDDQVLVVDAGTGIRRLGNALIAENRTQCTMFFTHAHWDHILGFPFFKLVHQPGAQIKVYGCPMEQGNMETLLSKTMAAPYFPVPYDNVLAQMEYFPACSGDSTRTIAGLEVHSIPLNHPNLGQGYKFVEDGKSFVFLTDNELSHAHPGGRSFDAYAQFCAGADLLVHDAEYTAEEYRSTQGWGHSTVRDALALAMRAGVRRFGLFHHNQDRTDVQVDELVLSCRQIIDKQGLDMECFAVWQDMRLTL